MPTALCCMPQLTLEIHSCMQTTRGAALERYRTSWRQLLLEGKGHRHVHLTVRSQNAWHPSSCLAEGGKVVSDPLALLWSEAAKFAGLCVFFVFFWGGGGGRVLFYPIYIYVLMVEK